jgi:hypothetical protein
MWYFWRIFYAHFSRVSVVAILVVLKAFTPFPFVVDLLHQNIDKLF